MQVPVDPIGARASLMAEFDALEALAQKSWGAKGGRAHGSSGSSSGSEDGGDGEGEASAWVWSGTVHCGEGECLGVHEVARCIAGRASAWVVGLGITHAIVDQCYGVS